MQPLTGMPDFPRKHLHPGQAELAANYITAKAERPSENPA